MQVNIGQPTEQTKVNASPEQGKVVLDPHPIKVKIFLDSHGNEIDPRTKQIINQADKENK